jgi:hypothetical protein
MYSTEAMKYYNCKASASQFTHPEAVFERNDTEKKTRSPVCTEF